MVRLELSPSEIAVDVGQSKRVKVTVIDAMGIETDVGDRVQWLTTGDAGLTIDAGWVTGVSTGDGEIRAVLNGIESGTMPVRVRGWSDGHILAQSGSVVSAGLGPHLAAAGPGGKAVVAADSAGTWRVHSFDATDRDSPWSPLQHDFSGTIAAVGLDAIGVLHVLELSTDTVVHAFADGVLVDSTTVGPGALAEWSKHELRYSENRDWAVFRSTSHGDVNRFVRWGASTGWEIPVHINHMRAGEVRIDDEGQLTVVGVDSAAALSVWSSTPGQSSFDAQVLDPAPVTSFLPCLSLALNGHGEGVALWHTPMGPKLVRLRDGRREGEVTFLDFDDDMATCHACGIADDGRSLVARTRGYPAFWLEAIRWDETGSLHHDLIFESTLSPRFGANAEGTLWMFARYNSTNDASIARWIAVRHDEELSWQDPQPVLAEYAPLSTPQIDFASDGLIVVAFRHHGPHGATDSIRAFVYH